MYAHCAWRSMPVQVADFCVARWPGGFGAGWALPRFQRVRSCPAGNRDFSLPPPGRLRKSDSLYRTVRGRRCRGCTLSQRFQPATVGGTLKSSAPVALSRPNGAEQLLWERASFVGAGLIRELAGLTREVALIRHDIFIALQLR